MLSGGIDSISILKRILLETDESLFVHHIHIKNYEGIQYPRYKKEAEAVRKIVAYKKKNFRNFNYTESTVDVRQIYELKPDYYTEKDFPLADLQFAPDQLYFYFIAGLLVKMTRSDKIYIGTCIEDYPHDDHPERFLAPHLSLNIQELYGLGDRQLRAAKIAEETSYPNKADIHRPHDDNLKKQNIEYIGEELMNMAWYCREPMEENGEYVVCHLCKSCRHVDNALSEKIN